MQKINVNVKSFVIGILTAIALMMLTGAVDHQTQNIGGDSTRSFQSISASSDGKTVYVCDNYTVYRSTDSGTNWAAVLKKSNNTGD